ncbi:MAG: SoxR reducing system RseC family protein [Bacteroidales bacterium]|nr:SoxR reducing system RseC family protein [Bacteroidales bacterium]
MGEHVSHPGVVVGINDKDLEIEILSSSMCGSCGIKSACGMSEMQEKRITVPKPVDKEFIVGQPVSITMSTSQGNKAALFAYFIPAFLLVAIIVILSNLSIKEWISALVGIGALAVYYVILYFFRDKLRNEFTYEIR